MNHEHDREEIIAANPLLEYCQAQGWQLKKDGSSRWTCWKRKFWDLPAPRRDNA